MAKATPSHLSYEAYLDEIATLLTEIYTLEDDAAIQIVMRAQADDRSGSANLNR